MHMRPILFLAVSATLLTAPAFSAPTAIDGWGAYKFGMSPDKARAVPGQTFGPYSATNIWNENKGSMGAKTHPVVDGVAYDFNLYFDAAGKLSGIGLENEKKTSLGDCGLVFLTLMANQEKSYGGFTAVEPERKRVDTDTPPTSVEWKAQGGSRYQLGTLTLADEYGYAWKARKSAGRNYVEVYATWASKPTDKSAPCISGISFGMK